MDCLKSVPVDKCCLVVQMPTVEEMKREVADITCEMQSVYIDDSAGTLPATSALPTISTDANTRPVHSSNFYKNQSVCNINEAETNFTDKNYKSTLNHKTADYDTKFGSLNLQQSDNHPRHNSSDSRWSTMEDIGGNGEEQETTESGLENTTEFKLNRFGSMLVSHKNANENLLSKFILPSVNSTSSGPREEQVSEEFIINGKRYRQVYQRRVVLERKTTRDVFFLPGNNTETDLRTSNKNHYEYKSPNYDKQLSSQASDDSPHNNSKSSPNDFIINRPGLDLTVLHTRNNSEDNEPCLSPAIILRSGNGTLNNYKGSHISACSKCQTSIPATSTLNNNSTSNASHQSAETVKRLSISDVNKTGRRTRNIVRSLSNSLKRSVSAGIQRTRSLVKSVPGKTKVAEGNQRPKKLSKLINNDVSEKDQEVNETRSKQIMGYMYKFGVWDDQQPVLDPRLPVFFDLSAENGSNLNGTVIPTAPEWHHAEVGLENIEQFQGAYVRSRTVACLQRFTQHSSASGKALHRSTYVQQTRLVRQLNRSGERKKDDSQTETEDSNKNKGFDHEVKVSNSTPTHLLTDPCVFDTNQFAKYDMRSEDCLHPTVEDNSARFTRCSNDRLQLLQSLCPSAAAATILLGKPMHDCQDNDDTNQENQFNNTPNYSDETRVLVTANAWCPVSLRTKDPNSQLLFNSTNKENNGNVSSKSNSPKHSPSSMSVPEPTIRGGTLDGLLIYALNLLQSPIPSNHPDYLFPDVIRLMYPTFTTIEKITERLIQIYVAYAPVEPGCQSSDWIDALTAADYLVTIATDIHPNKLSASLILRLNRFARLLMYDNQIISSALGISNEQAQGENPISQEPHRLLANRLLEKFPLFSSKQKLTNQLNSSRCKTNSKHIQTNLDELCNKREANDLLAKKSMTMNNSSVRQNDRNSVENVKRSSLQYPSLINDDIDLCITEPRRGAIQRASEFLEYDARSIAQEITQIEEEKFAEIEFQELLDIPHLEKGEAHSLARCVEHFNQITRWAKGMIFILAPNLLEKCSTLGSYHHEKINQKKSLFENFWSCHTSTAASNDVVKGKTKLQDDNDDTISNVEVKITTNNEEDDNLPKVNTFNKNFTLLSSQHKDISVKKIISLNIMLLKMCEVLKHLKELHNFSSFLALLLAIQEVPECLLSKKSKQLVATFSSYMKPPNFGEYRRDLEASQLPCLPYLGLIFQQLIHLHIGNPIHLPNSPTATLSKADFSKYTNETDTTGHNDSNSQMFKPLKVISAPPKSHKADLINVWRCWKHYMVLGYFIKRRGRNLENLHHFPHHPEINRIINEFKDQYADTLLDKAKDQLIGLQRSKRNILSR